MSPELMYRAYQIEERMRLEDPAREHRRALRGPRQPWQERIRSVAAALPRTRRTRLRRRPVLAPERAV